MNLIDCSLRIGIYYKDKEWAEQKCKEICNEIENNSYSGTCIVDRWDLIIYLGNGSYIKFLPASEHCRGNKFNRIYYQKGIEEDVLFQIIYPTLMNRSPQSLE